MECGSCHQRAEGFIRSCIRAYLSNQFFACGCARKSPFLFEEIVKFTNERRLRRAFETFISSPSHMHRKVWLIYACTSCMQYAASAIAANTVSRSAAGAAGHLFTNYMFYILGVGGDGDATFLAIILFVFYPYGERIRIKPKFASTPVQT